MQSKNTLFRTCPDDDALTLAADILRQGGLVAFPTETVYGLGGDALDPTASMRIYAAKGRPSDNPLIVHIADKKDVYALAEEVPPTANMLIEAFWPGPLTIILKKKPIVPDATTGGLPTVAIRMPSHPAAMEMIRRSGVYVAAPSALRRGYRYDPGRGSGGDWDRIHHRRPDVRHPHDPSAGIYNKGNAGSHRRPGRYGSISGTAG